MHLPYPILSRYHALILSALLLISIGKLKSQSFTNIAFDQGINVVNVFPTLGVAISFYDFDRDGWDDLTFGTKNEALKFYRNNQGVFEPYFPSGIDAVGECKMVVWVDYDNDGDSDLFVSYSLQPMKLYRNDGNMTFSEVGEASGLEQLETANWGSSWGDYNRDGHLDLYLCKYYISGDYLIEYEKLNRLYLNDGDGTFSDVTLAAGVSDSIGMSLQSIFWDYDNDMWPDLYVLNDEFFANGIYRNNGDGTFSDSGNETNLDIIMDAMSASAADFDNDGDEDMYISNTPNAGGYAGNVLLQNDNGVFTDITASAGAEVYNICWGITWFDYDNDGWLDFYVATNQGLQNPPNNKIFKNNGDGTFSDVSGVTGMQADVATSYTNCTGDINNDGYPDLAANNSLPYPSSVFRSSGGNKNYLKFSVEGVVSNRDGIGTKAFCYINEALQSRVFYAGESYMAQNSQREIVGMNDAENMDSLILYWPSGHVDKYYNIEANQTLHFIEGSSLQITTDISGLTGICEGNNIEITASPSENYTWNTGEESQAIIVESPGTYFVSTTNEFGLTSVSEPIEIYFFENAIIESESTIPNCHDGANGSVLFTNTSNTGIAELYIDGIAQNNPVNNLSPGNYEALIIDNNACSVEISVEIENPPLIIIEEITTNVQCFGANNGSIWIENTGGTGIQSVLWNGVIDANPLENITAGDYYYSLSDLNGCIIEGVVVITEPEELVAEPVTTDEIVGVQGGTATANISGGTPPYDFEWSNGSNEELITDLTEGAYGLSITDANGCETDIICIIDQIVSINNISVQNLSVRPNPFSNELFIEGCNTGDIISIMSIDGKLLHSEMATGIIHRVELPHLTVGIYLLQVSGSNQFIQSILRQN